eukprot:403338020
MMTPTNNMQKQQQETNIKSLFFSGDYRKPMQSNTGGQNSLDRQYEASNISGSQSPNKNRAYYEQSSYPSSRPISQITDQKTSPYLQNINNSHNRVDGTISQNTNQQKTLLDKNSNSTHGSNQQQTNSNFNIKSSVRDFKTSDTFATNLGQLKGQAPNPSGLSNNMNQFQYFQPQRLLSTQAGYQPPISPEKKRFDSGTRPLANQNFNNFSLIPAAKQNFNLTQQPDNTKSIEKQIFQIKPQSRNITDKVTITDQQNKQKKSSPTKVIKLKANPNQNLYQTMNPKFTGDKTLDIIKNHQQRYQNSSETMKQSNLAKSLGTDLTSNLFTRPKFSIDQTKFADSGIKSLLGYQQISTIKQDDAYSRSAGMKETLNSVFQGDNKVSQLSKYSNPSSLSQSQKFQEQFLNLHYQPKANNFTSSQNSNQTPKDFSQKYGNTQIITPKGFQTQGESFINRDLVNNNSSRERYPTQSHIFSDQYQTYNPSTSQTYHKLNNQRSSDMSYKDNNQFLKLLGNQQYPNPSFNSNQTNSGSFQSQDMEQIVINLHQKMKNLESKYLDLANYYKRELVTNKKYQSGKELNQFAQYHPNTIRQQNSRSQDIQNPQLYSQVNNYISERSVSPIRFEGQISQTNTQNGINTNISEKDLISELMKDKKELEQALHSMLEMQSSQQDKQSLMTQKLKIAQQDNQNLARMQQQSRTGQNIELNDGIISNEQIQNLRHQINQSIEKLENNLLIMINQNPEPLNDSDIIDQFSNYSYEVQKILDSILTRQSQMSSSRLSAKDLSNINNERNQQNDASRTRMKECEINNNYAQQNFKKAVFELQNNQNLQKLDVKKIKLTLESILKTSQEFQNQNQHSSQNYADARDYSNFNSMNKSANYDRSEIIDQKRSKLESPIVNNKFLDTLMQQLSQIKNCTNSLTDKFKDSDKVISTIQDVELDYQNNFTALKDSYKSLLNDFQKQNPNNLSPNITQNKSNSNLQRQESFKQNLFKLQNLNNDLQGQLELKCLDVKKLESENQLLLKRIESLNNQCNQLNTFNKINRNSHDVIMTRDQQKLILSDDEEIKEDQQKQNQDHLQNKISRLQSELNQVLMENGKLVNKLKTFDRTVQEKNQEIEKLGGELNQLSDDIQDKISGLRSQIPNIQVDDTIAQLQQIFDTQQDKLRQLVKNTQRFLQSMKKLQKAVHRKEADVSQEKGEFENHRRTLEIMLRTIKHELENPNSQQVRVDEVLRPITRLINQTQFAQQMNQTYNRFEIQEVQKVNRAGNNFNTGSGIRSNSVGERISNDSTPQINKQLYQYQNKVPLTISAKGRHEGEIAGRITQQRQLHHNNYQAATNRTASITPPPDAGTIRHQYSQTKQIFQLGDSRSSPQNKMQSENRSLEKSAENNAMTVSQIFQEGGNNQLTSLVNHQSSSSQSKHSQGAPTHMNNYISDKQDKDGVLIKSLKMKQLQSSGMTGQQQHQNNRTPSAKTKQPDILMTSINSQMSTIQKQPLMSNDQFPNLQDEVDYLKKELDKSLQERSQLEQDMQNLNQQIDQLTHQRNNAQRQLQIEQDQTATLASQIQELDTIRNQLIDENNQLRKTNDQLQEKNEQLSQSQHHISAFTASNILGSHQLQQQKHDDLDYSNLQIQYESMLQRVKQVSDQMEIVEKINKEYKKTISILEGSAEQSQQSINSLISKIEKKDHEIQELKDQQQQQIDSARSRNSKRQSQQSSDKLVVQQQQQQVQKQLQETKEDVQALIQDIEGKMIKKIGQLEVIVSQKDKQVKKLEKEVERVKQQQKDYVDKQNQYKQLMDQFKEKQSELKRIETENILLQDQLSQQQEELDTLRQLNEELNQKSDIFQQQSTEQHQNQLKQLKSDYKAKIQNLQQQNQQQIDELRDLHLEQLRDVEKTHKKNIDQAISELQEEMRQEQENQINEIEEYEKKLQFKDNQVQQYEKQIEQLNQEINQQTSQKEQKIQNLQQILKQLQIDQDLTIELLKQQQELEIAQLQQQLDQVQDENADQLEQLNQEKQSLIDLHKLDITRRDLQLQKLKDQHSQLVSQKEEAISELQSQLESQDILIRQLQENDQNTNHLFSEQNEQLKQQIKQKDQQLGELKVDYQNVRSECDELSDRITQLEHQSQLTQDQIEEVQNEKLQSEKDSQAHIQQLNNQIQELSKQSVKDKEQMEYMVSELEEFQKLQDDFNEQIQQKDQTVNNLEHKLQDLQSELETKDQDIMGKNLQIQSKDQTLKKIQKDLESHKSQVQELVQNNQGLENQIQELKQREQDLIANSKQQQTLQSSNDINFEKSQMYLELQGDVEKKDQEIGEYLTQIQDNEKQIKSMKQQLEQSEAENSQQQTNLLQKITDLEQELSQLKSDNEEMEDYISKHSHTLEANKNTIIGLRNELQKAIDKNKAQKEENSIQSKLKDEELGTLRDKIVSLKQQFEEKLNKQLEIVALKDKELRLQNELVEDANKLLGEIQEEKQFIKTKLKVLKDLIDKERKNSLEIHNNPSSPSLQLKSLQNTNKNQNIEVEDVDDIEIEQCIDQLEKQVLGLLQQKIIMQNNVKTTQVDKEKVQKELEETQSSAQLLEKQIKDLNVQLQNALTKMDINDADMRKQLDTASRKIQNYREKVIAKQKQINSLEQEKRELQQSKIDMMNSRVLTPPMNNSIRELELLQRLQRAEHELQQYRFAGIQPNNAAGNQNNIKNKQNVNNNNDSDQSIEVDATRIKEMEEQLKNLRTQLFSARQQVLQQLTENFAKQLKDITKIYQNESLLKNKITQLQTDKDLQSINNCYKLIKIVDLEKNYSLSKNAESGYRVLIVQHSISKEIAFIDESKLSATAIVFLQSFIPSNLNDVEISNLKIDPTQERILNQLEDKIFEIREERQELQQELLIYKNKLMNGQGFDNVDLEMIEREDDIELLNDKNQQLRLKVKDLGEDNLLMKQRIIELNEIVKDLSIKRSSSSNTQNSSIQQQTPQLLKLLDENENLRNSLQQMQQQVQELTSQLQNVPNKQRQPSGQFNVKNQPFIIGTSSQVPGGQGQNFDENNLANFTDQDFNEGSFLQGIQAAQNLHNDSLQQQDNNIFDQSSLYGAILQGIEGGNGDRPESNLNLNIEDQHESQSNATSNTRRQGTPADTQLVHQLRQQLSELENQLSKLEIENQGLSQEVKKLKEDLEKKDQQLFNKEDQGILNHVKGTLIQYLKNCPLTDKNNEILLDVVLSVLEFTKEEQVDLADNRSRKRSTSVSGIQDSQQDNGDNGSRSRKAAASLFGGMFGKKKDPNMSSKEVSLSRQNNQISPSPIRSMQRK